MGIRSVYIDRWGVGLSSNNPTGKLKDFADDVLELADLLNIEQFAVVGGSGGGPYVYACAAVLPSNRLICSQIHVPVAPNHPSRSLTMPWIASVQHLISRHLFWSKMTETKWLKLLKNMGTANADFDTMFTDSKKWVWFFQNSGLDYTRNGIGAAHKEASLLKSPANWNLPSNNHQLESPCTVYVGADDKNTPVVCAEWYRQQNSSINVKIYEGEGHFSLESSHQFHAETLSNLDENFRRKGL